MNQTQGALTNPQAGRRNWALPALLVAAALTTFLGGCAQKKLPVINESQFQQLVLESKQPVLVEFSKDECPTCIALEGQLVDISKEYAGRVKFYKFMLLNRIFQPYAPAIKDMYKLDWVPTAILFVNGQETQRWNNVYIPDSYRTALTELVGPPAKPSTPPPTASQSQPARTRASSTPTGSAF